jgi:hypothetical protein
MATIGNTLGGPGVDARREWRTRRRRAMTASDCGLGGAARRHKMAS